MCSGSPSAPTSPGTTEMIRTWIAIAASTSHGRRQLQLRERAQAPARERDRQQAQQVGEAEDH